MNGEESQESVSGKVTKEFNLAVVTRLEVWGLQRAKQAWSLQALKQCCPLGADRQERPDREAAMGIVRMRAAATLSQAPAWGSRPGKRRVGR